MDYTLPGFNFNLNDEEEPNDYRKILSEFQSTPISSYSSPIQQETPESIMGGMGGREERLSQIDQALAAIQKEQQGRLGTMNEETPMTGDQMLATAIAGFLPMVMGKMIAGNAGLAGGADVGMKSATSAMDMFGKEGEKKKAKAKLEYDSAKEQLKELMNQRQDLQKQAFGAEDSMNLEKYKTSKAFGLQNDDQDFALQLEKLRQAGMNSRSAAALSAANNRSNEEDARSKRFEDIRLLQLEGNEANRLVQKFQANPLVKSAASSMQAASRIQSALQNPSSVTAGQLGTQLAVLAGEVGMKTEGDIQRNLGDTLFKRYTSAKNFLMNNAESTIAPEQAQAIQALVNEMLPKAQARVSAVRQEMENSGLAPYLAREGKLDKVIESLGSSIDSLGNSAKQSGKITQETPDGVWEKQPNGAWRLIK